MKSKSENVTLQIASENTQLQPNIQNTRDDTDSGIICNTTLENTLSNKKNESNFLKLVGNQNSDFFWNGKEVKKVGNTKK